MNKNRALKKKVDKLKDMVFEKNKLYTQVATMEEERQVGKSHFLIIDY